MIATSLALTAIERVLRWLVLDFTAVTLDPSTIGASVNALALRNS